jgi:putative nucleotidyltransferase with HDIG domain
MITAQDIEALFLPQISKVVDVSVRKAVVKAWLLGCERGGWRSLEEVKRIPFTLLTNPQGIGLIEHTIAVTEGAVGLALAQTSSYSKMPYAIDMDRLIAGGILHDVGKLLEIEQDGKGGYRKSRNGRCARHPISGAVLAAEAGLSPEYVNIVACHAKEGDGRPQVVETILVHQADFATFDPVAFKNRGDLIE